MKSNLAVCVFCISASCFAQKAQARPTATVAEQKECYDQAQKYRSEHTIVIQHFSKKENVCFVRTYTWLRDPDDHNKLEGCSAQVVDGFEGVTYGTCITDAGGKATVCEMSDPDGGKNKEFTSLDSWLKFSMASYFSKGY